MKESNFLKSKESLDRHTFDYSLWKRFEGQSLDERQTEFITQCMCQNLEHARHLENERLTFNSIFLALVAGAMAFAGTLNPAVTFGIYLFLTVAGFLSMVLTARWNNAFSRHIFYAQKCYNLLHINLFGATDEPAEDWKTQESIDGLNEIPMYCFKVHRPISHVRPGEILYKPRTRHLYTAFYWIIQLLLILCTLLELVKII